MSSASEDIREISYDEISHVTGGVVDPITPVMVLAIMAMGVAAYAAGQFLGKTIAEHHNNQNKKRIEAEQKMLEEYKQSANNWGPYRGY